MLKTPTPAPRKSPPQIKKSDSLRHSPATAVVRKTGSKKSPSLRRKHEEEEEEETGVRVPTYSGLVGRQSGGKDRPPERTESSNGKCRDVFLATHNFLLVVWFSWPCTYMFRAI